MTVGFCASDRCASRRLDDDEGWNAVIIPRMTIESPILNWMSTCDFRVPASARKSHCAILVDRQSIFPSYDPFLGSFYDTPLPYPYRIPHLPYTPPNCRCGRTCRARTGTPCPRRSTAARPRWSASGRYGSTGTDDRGLTLLDMRLR